MQASQCRHVDCSRHFPCGIVQFQSFPDPVFARSFDKPRPDRKALGQAGAIPEAVAVVVQGSDQGGPGNLPHRRRRLLDPPPLRLPRCTPGGSHHCSPENDTAPSTSPPLNPTTHPNPPASPFFGPEASTCVPLEFPTKHPTEPACSHNHPRRNTAGERVPP